MWELKYANLHVDYEELKQENAELRKLLLERPAEPEPNPGETLGDFIYRKTKERFDEAKEDVEEQIVNGGEPEGEKPHFYITEKPLGPGDFEYANGVANTDNCESKKPQPEKHDQGVIEDEVCELPIPQPEDGKWDKSSALQATYACVHNWGPCAVKSISKRSGASPSRVKTSLKELIKHGRVVQVKFAVGNVQRDCYVLPEHADIETMKRRAARPKPPLPDKPKKRSYEKLANQTAPVEEKKPDSETELPSELDLLLE